MKQALVKLGMSESERTAIMIGLTIRLSMEKTQRKKNTTKNYVFAALKRSQFRAKDINSLVAMLCQH